VWLSTSTKPILKEVLIKYIQNKVVQVPNNAIFKRNYIFWLILNDVEKKSLLKKYFHLKDNKNYVGDLCIRIHFTCLSKC
jgi:hypothetical protein